MSGSFKDTLDLELGRIESAMVDHEYIDVNNDSQTRLPPTELSPFELPPPAIPLDIRKRQIEDHDGETVCSQFMDFMMGAGWRSYPNDMIMESQFVMNENDYAFDMNKVLLLRLVGRGAYGDVWMAQDLQLQKIIAVKKFYLTRERDSVDKTILREISLLNELKGHPNVVTLLGVDMISGSIDACLSAGEITALASLRDSVAIPSRIEMEDSKCGYLKPTRPVLTIDEEDSKASASSICAGFEFTPFDLNSYLRRSTAMKIDICAEEQAYIIRGVLEGLEYVHSHNILHRDMKSGNILIDMNGHIKIADFGLARKLLRARTGICTDDLFAEPLNPAVDSTPNLSNNVVTLWYRSPELLLHSPTYNFACDIFSLGCIVYEIITRLPLFANANTEERMMTKIIELLGPLDTMTWPDCSELPMYPVFSKIIVDPAQAKLTRHKFKQDLTEVQADFIMSCLCLNPKARLTASELLRHRFFDVYVPKKLKLPIDCMYMAAENVLRKDSERMNSISNKIPPRHKRLFAVGTHLERERKVELDEIRYSGSKAANAKKTYIRTQSSLTYPPGEEEGEIA